MKRITAIILLTLTLVVGATRVGFAGTSTYTGTGCTGFYHEVCYRHRHTVAGGTTYHTSHARFGVPLHGMHATWTGGKWVFQYLTY